VRGFTLPWQLVELHEPGPVYLLASAGGFAALAGFMQATKKAPSESKAHRNSKREAIYLTVIPIDRMNATLFAHFESPYCSGIFIVYARFEVNQTDEWYFQGRDKPTRAARARMAFS
jgi:hypothetical protein